MSKVNKTDNVDGIAGVMEVNDDEVSWDVLNRTYKETAKDIIDLQCLVVKMVEENEDKVNNNPETFNTVKGLLNTVNDVSVELREVYDGYKNKREVTTGLIDTEVEEDVILYIETMSDFVSIGEKFSNLTSTAVTDVFIAIQAGDDIVKDAITLQNEIATTTINKG